jgi:transcriptional regulator with XRE-family HTH domain
MAKKAKKDLLGSFGTRVRNARTAEQVSQEEFAARCGLDRTYISGIERGVRNISLWNIYLIADALHLSVSDLTKDIEK